jgi:sortase (surface protein transpeptidase)
MANKLSKINFKQTKVIVPVVATAVVVIAPTSHAVLTLNTCYPFNNIGATTHAYVVSADLLQSTVD